MLNIISSLVIAGVLSATAIDAILGLQDHAEVVADDYVSSAEKRFKDYDEMLPGVVDWSRQ